jgi:hypothetical protein
VEEKKERALTPPLKVRGGWGSYDKIEKTKKFNVTPPASPYIKGKRRKKEP